MRTCLHLGLVLVGVLVSACADREPPATSSDPAALGDFLSGPAEGFARAEGPHAFEFPRDHGPHPAFRSEWWYFTGNLQDPGGRPFGFQLTLFRFALSPDAEPRASAWATNQVYMGHLALSDIEAGEFHSFERFSRGALGLAGARSSPFRVWVEDWVIEGEGAKKPDFTLRAADGGVGIDLRLVSEKPLVLQGDDGLSQKSGEAGNASYYYSVTRMPAKGNIVLDGTVHEVSGLAWLDREWGTSALSDEQEGWDWFSLQLSDGSEIMFYQLRRRDGTVDPFSSGSHVAADGSVEHLDARDLVLEVLDYWESPKDGARYPAAWRITVPQRELVMEVIPRMPDQEIALLVRYWEGAVAVTGRVGGTPLRGHGYAELTGYAKSPSGIERR